MICASGSTSPAGWRRRPSTIGRRGVPLAKMKPLMDYWRNQYELAPLREGPQRFRPSSRPRSTASTSTSSTSRSPRAERDAAAAHPWLAGFRWSSFFKGDRPRSSIRLRMAARLRKPSMSSRRRLPGYGLFGQAEGDGAGTSRRFSRTWIKLMGSVLGYERLVGAGRRLGLARSPRWIGHYAPKGPDWQSTSTAPSWRHPENPGEVTEERAER